MIDLTIVVILALATYGITDNLAKQNGPFRIFKRWRDYLGRNKPDIDEENDNAEDWELYNKLFDAWQASPTGQLHELFACPFCLGVWVSAPLTVVYAGIGWYTLVYWLAVIGLHNGIVRGLK